jgi:chloroplast NAD(P)H dehydrogenase
METITVLMISESIKATAFGMKSVVYVPRIKPETVSALSALCDKATMVSTGDVL